MIGVVCWWVNYLNQGLWIDLSGFICGFKLIIKLLNLGKLSKRPPNHTIEFKLNLLFCIIYEFSNLFICC